MSKVRKHSQFDDFDDVQDFHSKKNLRQKKRNEIEDDAFTE